MQMPGAWFLETDLCEEQADLKGQSSKHISGRGKGQKKKKGPLAIGWWKRKGEIWCHTRQNNHKIEGLSSMIKILCYDLL